MAEDEISSFVYKFNQLKKTGNRAFLWLECEAGQSFITLQVHHEELSGHKHGAHPQHRRHGQEDSRHHSHCQEDRHHYQEPHHPQTRRPGPARLRRHEVRAKARAAKLSAEQAENKVAVEADITAAAAPSSAKEVNIAAAEAAVTLPPPAVKTDQPSQAQENPKQVEMISPIPLYVWHSPRPPKRPKRRYPRGIIQPSSDPLNPIHAMTLELSHRVAQSQSLPSPHPSSTLSAGLCLLHPAPT